MAKEYQFNWRTKVPDALLKGAYFDRYDDVRFIHSLFLAVVSYNQLNIS